MNARRLILSVFAMVVGSLVFGSVPALAAEAPEAPGLVVVEGVTATSATFQGELNPGKTGPAGSYELDTYEFLYNQGNNCEGGSRTPEPAGMSLGGGQEALSPQAASGLQSDTEYTVCLLARNTVEETALSPPVTFTTGAAVPTIAGESVANVEAAAATLEARVDPEGAVTTYHFEYGTTEAYGQSTPESGSIGEDNLDHTATAMITGLQPSTTYHYRVVATNSLSPGGIPGPDKSLSTPAALGSAYSEGCPNEQLRSEQPYGLELPDCRGYEMVSPVEKNGADATDPETDLACASVSGDAIVFTSRGSFADPAGSQPNNQFLSQRGPTGWSTQSITPPYDAYNSTALISPYETLTFTPELSKGVADTVASLTSDAPAGFFELYVADFTNGSYQWVSNAPLAPKELSVPYSSTKVKVGLFDPMGASTDLSHVVFFVQGDPYAPDGTVNGDALYEWIDGEVIRVGVANSGEPLSGSAGLFNSNFGSSALESDVWNAVSSDGSRVFFTSPEVEEAGQLYVRENTGQPQSPLASPESHGTGIVTEGSNRVTEVASLFAAYSTATVTSGSTEVTLLESDAQYTTRGAFFAGQAVSGPGIPPGTTIVKVSGHTVTLSAPATATEEAISSEYPLTFAVGQKITGRGIPRGTTITAVAPGALTLSAPAAESGSAVVLDAGGECTVSADACTVEVSGSQRGVPDPSGPQAARYVGASANGRKVFFTSSAELTEDAYTGPADSAENLYEYDLESGKLTDLTVDRADPDGAAVQGVVQISEDGSYVYFVAQGDLAEGAVAGEANLYVSHEGGAPRFIATLAKGNGEGTNDDELDWRDSFRTDTSALSGDGTRLAFVSERSLTGYDNERAENGVETCTHEGSEYIYGKEGRCREVYLYDASTSSLTCVSCNPSGARPIGPSSLGEAGDGYEGEYNHDIQHRRRNFSEDGSRLFFQSYDALVPHDSNGWQDVYEYEDGHVYPISDVAGDSNSYFLDASADGSDVFFATADQLVAQDKDESIDVYDARIGGGFQAPASVAPCDNGDSCKPPPAPQPAVLGAPASAKFSGSGNIVQPPPLVAKPKPKKRTGRCAKGKKLSRGRCVKRKGAGRAKKSANKGRK